MNLKKYLLEENSEIQVDVRQLTSSEKKIIEKFQAVISYVVKYFKIKDPTEKDYYDFKHSIWQYIKLPFCAPLRRFIKEVDEKLKSKELSIPEVPKILKDFSKDLDDTVSLFLSKKVDQAYEKALKLKNKSKMLINAKLNPTNIITKRSPVFSLSPETIFQTDDFIKTGFSLKDMEDLVYKDLKVYNYTYLNFPEKMLNNYQYLVYFIQKLKKDTRKVILTGKEFRDFSEFLYQNDNFSEFKKLVSDYLHNNNKKLIPEIMEKLKSYPKLVEMNEKLKKETKVVYRGIAFTVDDQIPTEKKIEQIEKKNQYVATSKSKHTASLFAERRGHLMGGRTSKVGYILVYDTSNPKSILIDSDIFGAIFGEGEVLIDTKYAKLTEIIDIDYE